MDDGLRNALKGIGDSPIIESIDNGVIVFDASNIVVFANPAAVRLLQRPDGRTLVGLAAAEILSEVIDPDERAVTLDMLGSGKPGAGMKVAWPDKTVAVTFVPVTVDDRIAGTALVMRDITRELGARQIQFHFMDTLAHELRTPMTLMLGYAEALQQGKDVTLVDEVVKYVAVLNNVVDNLVTLAQLQSQGLARYAPVNVSQTARDAVAGLAATAEKADLTIVGDIANDIVIWGDPGLLRRAVDELLDNAIKFTPGRGLIVLKIRRAEGGAAIEVSDTGVGIEPGHLPSVFERFYQADSSTTRRYGGLGLGLAVVREIIAAHGGRIAIESAAGAGARVSVWLPEDGKNLCK